MHSSVLTLLTQRAFSIAGPGLAAALLASCASSKTANHLAGTTISELAAYEKSVEDKINAEKGFYRAQSAKLIELQGYSVLPKVDAATKGTKQTPRVAASTSAAFNAKEFNEAAAKDESAAVTTTPTPGATSTTATSATPPADPAADRIRSSLPYLRITAASEREAVVAIDKVLGQGTPAARSAFMGYVSDGVVNDGAQVEKAVQSRQLMDAAVTANLAKLDSGKSNLAAAREALTQTTQKKSFFARLKDALSFGKEARDLYEAKQTKPKPKT